MTNLTPQEKSRLLTAAELVDKGDFAVIKNLMEHRDFLEEYAAKIDSALENAKKVFASMVEKTDSIKDGYTPVKGVDYNDGEDFVPTEADLQRIADKVKVPIVEKVIERTETIHEQPIVNTEIVKEVVRENVDTPEQLRDKLQTLKGDDRLDKSAIRDLSETLEAFTKKIESRLTNTAGGVSNLRIQQAFKYILKTEVPVGDIDGINTTYSVSQNIFAILSFGVNGETIAQLPNYTISGRKIIFATALPAVYSGKDFEVKFI